MRKGFTLIELLVVIAIIGIISSVVLACFSDVSEKTPQEERAWCESYGSYSIRSLPVKCLKYFNVDTTLTNYEE